MSNLDDSSCMIIPLFKIKRNRSRTRNQELTVCGLSRVILRGYCRLGRLGMGTNATFDLFFQGGQVTRTPGGSKNILL